MYIELLAYVLFLDFTECKSKSQIQ